MGQREEREPEEGEQQEPEPLSTREVAQAGAGMARLFRNAEVASTLEEIWQDTDLDEPGVDAAIKFLRESGQVQLADDLGSRRAAVREAVAKVRVEQEQADAKVRAEALKKEAHAQLAKERQEQEEKAAREAALAEILADEERARAIATGEQVPDITESMSEILAEVDALRKTPGTEYGTAVQALNLKMARVFPLNEDAPPGLADVMGNPAISAAARVDAWTNADPDARAMATQLGVVPPFDLDVDSSEYRKQLAAFQKESSDTEAWAAEQLERGKK